ncbi:thiamine pyrophosphate-binding protein [Gloeocapsa sp. PCC 73106]|uniref:thiamine pyrophosphate-binding protein n=1 Tax=Gloeocapsa sp. PCC 73106 TaxID=102232 RepID=UPI0002AD1812|nr:thiamine pyrophosphate-binding protein [Gloeocapsa sp. PCC 73106]ELR98753.1 thiamine pyrophosphate-dependent enzyme, possible carboligase or decarboxylase [Gloeocapsa sp. PCC 73106]
MTNKTGRFALIEQFLADGMDHMFGNPGTVEQGFLDALGNYPEMKYVATLQETIALMIADGYARATEKPTLVQIHSTPGLGNTIGALYQAKRGHSPLVVIGGDAGICYQAMDAQMAGDLVAFAEPVTKWSTMVMDPNSLLRVIRRAIKIAATPPMGPVYVCLPQDIMDAPLTEAITESGAQGAITKGGAQRAITESGAQRAITESGAQRAIAPTNFPSTRVIPSEELLEQAADILVSGQKPMIFIGDGVAFSGAQEELTRVAELLGAEVWSADAGEVNMSLEHPLYQGSTGHMFGDQSLPITSKGDVNLICGTYMLPEVFPKLGNIFAPGAKSVHIDLNAYEIGKNHPVDLGLVSDPKLTLARLAQLLEAKLKPEQKQAAANRLESLGKSKQDAVNKQKQQDQALKGQVPLHFATFMQELAPRLPKDTIIFDEALTNSPPISRYYPITEPGSYFQTRGGSLGVGIPGAIGVKLAHKDRPVWGFTGDGGAMYTIQALWTAARHNVDAKFVICNNSSYRLLQLNIQAYWQERNIPKRDFPLSFDLSKPAINFAQLAQSLGVQACRVEQPEEIIPAIEQALAHEGPFLIDLVLEGDVHPELIGIRCGQ